MKEKKETKIMEPGEKHERSLFNNSRYQLQNMPTS